MRRYVLFLVLVLLLLLPSSVSANGNNGGKPVRDCSNTTEPTKHLVPEADWEKPGVPEYFYLAEAGGVQVYNGRLRSRNNRVMCAFLYQDESMERPDGASVTDRKLNRRRQGTPPTADIWNGYSRRIDTFRIMAPPGCVVGVRMWTKKNGENVLVADRTVWNKKGKKAKFKGFYFLPAFVNKVTMVQTFSRGCPGLLLDYREA